MLINLENINKDYIQGRESVHILDNINLSVDDGDYIAIMGPSGSGKTTLMNIMGCLDVPTSGIYRFRDEILANASENRLADIRNRHIGFVFQSFYLLPRLNAIDNVALPLLYAGIGRQERRERAIDALREVGLEDRLKYMPNQLSGGQQQRVAIARAMISKPDILFADEPTGALDSSSGLQIMDIFSRLNNVGTSIVMITHEPSIAEHASKIYYIRDGVLRTEKGGE